MRFRTNSEQQDALLLITKLTCITRQLNEV
jgi:hypothetical protein